MTPSETTDFVATIADAYPERFRATPSLARLWAAMLADLPGDVARKALVEHIAESPHVPTIADIRTRAARARVDAPDVAIAWGEVLRAISREGRDRTPVFTHAAIAEAVEGMGWRAICDSPTEGTNTLRAQFERLYNARQTTLRREANVGALEAHQERVGQLGAGDLVAGLLGKGGKP